MVKRTRLQTKTDDLAFPVRVKFVVPSGGLGGVSDRLHVWLQEELGGREYAVHSAQSIGCQAIGIHFRTSEAAQRFIGAFPELQLADGTGSPAYVSPAKRAATLSRATQ